MDITLSPPWVQHVARYNPVDWAVVASRQALSAHTDWGAVWPRLGLPRRACRDHGVAGHPRVRQLPTLNLTGTGEAGTAP